MKLKLFEIVQAFESFTEIQQTNKIDFQLSWQIEDIKELLQKHYNRFNDEKNKIVKELGKPEKPESDTFLILPENMTVFNEKIENIGNIPIDIRNPVKLKKTALFDSDLKINGKVNLKLLKLFIDSKK